MLMYILQYYFFFFQVHKAFISGKKTPHTDENLHISLDLWLSVTRWAVLGGY